MQTSPNIRLGEDTGDCPPPPRGTWAVTWLSCLMLVPTVACFQETHHSHPSGLWQTLTHSRSWHWEQPLVLFVGTISQKYLCPHSDSSCWHQIHSHQTFSSWHSRCKVCRTQWDKPETYFWQTISFSNYLYIPSITLTYQCRIYWSMASVLTFSCLLNTEICFRLFSCHYAIF